MEHAGRASLAIRSFHKFRSLRKIGGKLSVCSQKSLQLFKTPSGSRVQGNLAEFVKSYPAAKAYYELGAAQQTFKLPEPGYLEGIKTKDRAIIKLKDVTFQYALNMEHVPFFLLRTLQMKSLCPRGWPTPLLLLHGGRVCVCVDSAEASRGCHVNVLSSAGALWCCCHV
jgi:hypothetical protein